MSALDKKYLNIFIQLQIVINVYMANTFEIMFKGSLSTCMPVHILNWWLCCRYCWCCWCPIFVTFIGILPLFFHLLHMMVAFHLHLNFSLLLSNIESPPLLLLNDTLWFNGPPSQIASWQSGFQLVDRC